MDLRTAIWDERLDAQMRKRYFGSLADRYRMKATCTEAISAIASTAAVVSWLAAHCPEVAAALSIAAAIAATLQNTLKWHQKAADAGAVEQHWLRRARSWDALWIQVEHDPLQVTLDRYQMERTLDADVDDPKIATNDSLLRKSQIDTHRSLGLG